jgi:hypothetical protein
MLATPGVSWTIYLPIPPVRTSGSGITSSRWSIGSAASLTNVSVTLGKRPGRGDPVAMPRDARPLYAPHFFNTLFSSTTLSCRLHDAHAGDPSMVPVS